MVRSRLAEALDKVRHLSQRWRKAALVVGGLVLCEVGARIALPDLNGSVLSEYLRGSGRLLLRLYDWLAGGATSRGAVLALGILPYVSARIFVRLSREAFPSVAEMWTREEGRSKLT